MNNYYEEKKDKISKKKLLIGAILVVFISILVFISSSFNFLSNTIVDISIPQYSVITKNGTSSIVKDDVNARVGNKDNIQQIKLDILNMPNDFELYYSSLSENGTWTNWIKINKNALIGEKNKILQGIRFKIEGKYKNLYTVKYGGRQSNGEWTGYKRNSDTLKVSNLDTFKMKIYRTSNTNTSKPTETKPNSNVLKNWKHNDNQTNINIDKIRMYNSDVYVVNAKIKDAKQFKHIYAGGKSPTGKLETVQDMTKKYNPILAINASGFKKDNNNELWGTVGSAGKIDEYKQQNKPSIYMDYKGNLRSITPNSKSELESKKPFWVATFGPRLINEGKNLQVNSNSNEIAPRTAIGQGKNPNEFTIIVVDGRSSSSRGVTLKELASIFEKYGCKNAYNLDGGGSSTLVFKGQVINNPSDKNGVRNVGDALFIRNI